MAIMIAEIDNHSQRNELQDLKPCSIGPTIRKSIIDTIMNASNAR